MLINILLGTIGMIVANVVGSFAATQVLMSRPVLAALMQHPGLGPIVFLGPAALLICAALLAGGLFTRLNRSLSVVEPAVGTVLYLGLQAGLVLASGNRPGTPALVMGVAFAACDILAFWLPSALHAWKAGSLGAAPVAMQGSGLLGALATCLLLPLIMGPALLTTGAAALEPLRPAPMMPRFGDAEHITRALAAGTPAQEDPDRHANRAAVMVAADRLRGDPCDSAAYYELRRALLVFLNSNVDQWYRKRPEPISLDGRLVNASHELDAPATEVFRQAFAAQIVHFNDLPADIRNALPQLRTAPPDQRRAAASGFVCTR
ncbi:MAG TPA: hypothetical protein VMB34_33785 [Acetobacteraceae bacterium]|nr:hypothetical protein [Acetobacteraceae bacterium]